jgi:hypothetical protein
MGRVRRRGGLGLGRGAGVESPSVVEQSVFLQLRSGTERTELTFATTPACTRRPPGRTSPAQPMPEVQSAMGWRLALNSRRGQRRSSADLPAWAAGRQTERLDQQGQDHRRKQVVAVAVAVAGEAVEYRKKIYSSRCQSCGYSEQSVRNFMKLSICINKSRRWSRRGADASVAACLLRNRTARPSSS